MIGGQPGERCRVLCMAVAPPLGWRVPTCLAGIGHGRSMYWWMDTVERVPRVASVPIALLVGGVLGAALGRVTLWLTSWPKGLVMILTLVATLLLYAGADPFLPGWNPEGATVFGNGGFDVALVHVSADQIGSLSSCLVVVIGTTWVLRRTRFGLHVRVIYDEPDTAATMGIPINLITSAYAPDLISGML
jgi:branched-subunit amino acid ABC-type transport system permease component